jgi:ribonuclease HI
MPSTAGAAEHILEQGAYRLEFDGGSRNNGAANAVAGYGFALFSPSEEQAVKAAGPMAPGSTNNEAEYTALVRGLEAAQKLGVRRMLVQGDSDLVVKQVKGQYKVNAVNLQPLHRRVGQLRAEFDHFEIKHVYRNQNATADHLSNVAMDLADMLCQMARRPETAAGLLGQLQQVARLTDDEVAQCRDAGDLLGAVVQLLPSKCGVSCEELRQFLARCA